MSKPPGAESQPASVWPASTRPAALGEPGGDAVRSAASARDLAQAPHAHARFDICASALALRIVLAVQAALAIGVLFGAGNGADWLGRQAVAVFAGLAATLLWMVGMCLSKTVLTRLSRSGRLAVLAGWGAACALVAWWPLVWIDLADGTALRLGGVASAGAALAAALGVWLDQRERLWQPSETRVRLAELQSRIRPHFLFNALNTAVALVRTEPARAEGVLEDLAELFRAALAEAGASVSLDEEFDLARRYLAIEQLRYGNRLHLSWDIDPRVLAARVPALVLQPLVENAVRHGVEPSARGARIWVQASARRGQAVVLVSNSLPDAPSAPGQGMALDNVRERLHLLHDLAGQCEVWREAGLFRARITVPLRA